MAHVLVTGGTGALGSRLVAVLVRRGHDVRSLSRHGAPDGGDGSPAATAMAGVDAGADVDAGANAAGVTYLRGDVLSGAGLAEAVDGVDTVIHAVTSPRLSRAVEVDGTANVVAAAAATGAHVIYMSIVGVDVMSYSYYQSKFEAEKIVASGDAPWTIQRATQFHDLIDRFLGWRVFPVTSHLAFQPVDTGDVSARLADLVDAGPSGRADDMGGPAVVPLRQLAATRRRITGARTLLIPAPRLGPLKGFDAGLHLTPDHAVGRVTWEQWIRSRPRGGWEPR